MRAAVIESPGCVAVRDVPAARAADGRALVRVSQAGICGTDLKIAAGDVPVVAPVVLGHEMTGQVEVPGRAGALAPGTAVLLNPSPFCGRCDRCRRDLPHLCRHGRLLGRDADGCFAEYIAADEALLIRFRIRSRAMRVRCSRCSRPAFTRSRRSGRGRKTSLW